MLESLIPLGDQVWSSWKMSMLSMASVNLGTYCHDDNSILVVFVFTQCRLICDVLIRIKADRFQRLISRYRE